MRPASTWIKRRRPARSVTVVQKMHPVFEKRKKDTGILTIVNVTRRAST
jgi:hypothetical protein